MEVNRAWIYGYNLHHSLGCNYLAMRRLLVTPCCWCGYGNLFTRSIAIPRAAEGKRDIAMLNVGNFTYPRKQTLGNVFIPWSNYVCHTLKRFRIHYIPAIPFIWLESLYINRVIRWHRSGKKIEWRSWSPSSWLWHHQWRSFLYISHADNVKRKIPVHTSDG